ncbi:MAG: MerR family transcriptional regulator [Roseiflexaceae bacterium]
MFKIGDFSKFSHVSIKMLRHYDRLGLLRPARIDPATSYRYYSADQLPRLNHILALRDLGFTLEQIAALLDDVPAEQIRGMLKLKQAELEQQMHDEQRRLERIAARLKQIECEGRTYAADVIVRRIEPQLMATLRQVAPDGDDLQLLFEEVEIYVARHDARADRPPLAIYHDGEYRERDLDVEVAIPLRARIPGAGQVRVRELPGCDSMACLVHTGSYDTIGAAAGALLAWSEANGYQIAGPSREVYLRFSADGLNIMLPAAYLAHGDADCVTELQLPLAKA